MNDLLKLVIEAHGGLEKWNQFNKVNIHMLVDGALWHLKGVPGIISDTRFEANLRKQESKYFDFVKPGQEAIFTPDRVTLVENGKVKEELLEPLNSFRGHKFETPWSKTQMVYFGGYAMWGYLTAPFNFTLPGVETKEIEPWHESGETWRRLHVTYPENLAVHTREQVFYFDEKGLLKRFDYQVDVNVNVPAAHYVFDYEEFQGIKMPTRRLVYARDENNNYVKEPLVVRVDLLDVEFS